MEAIPPFPLHWPQSHPRTEKPRTSNFKDNLTVAKARDGLLGELLRWKARSVVISSNAHTKKDGTPYSTFPPVQDAGVAVYFWLKNELHVIPCDEYKTIQENLQAIKYVVESLRTIERHGGNKLFKTASTGFKALPEATSARHWYQVLQIPENASKAQINEAYKERVKTAHPDRGGTAEKLQEVVLAREIGLTRAK